MSTNENRYNPQYIKEKSVAVLVANGMSESDSKVVVESMIEADMCGVSTHGIRMLPSYVKKLKQGEFSVCQPEVIKSLAAFTTMDSKGTMGAVSAYKATEIAVNKAKEHGMHAVFAKNCNTFGPAFYFAELMAKEGLVGFVCCNAPSAMPAFNGLETMLGTNPLAFACPSKTKGSIVLDMATSIVAKSRFATARANGETLPEGWALDKDGNPTTDPEEAIKGFVLPMAGFKGYGIAMMIDIVAGFMSGAGYLNKVGKFYSQTGDCMNVGQLFVAIDPSLVYDGDFLSEMDEYISILRNSKSIPGKSIAVPGDDRELARQMSQKAGIKLDEPVVVSLEELFGEKLK